MRVILLTSRVDRPSFRFRVEQVFPYFSQRGQTCELAGVEKEVTAILPKTPRKSAGTRYRPVSATIAGTVG